MDTIFCDEKEKRQKNVSHKYKNKLDFPFSEILAKTMRENSSPRISRVTVIQELETENKKRAVIKVYLGSFDLYQIQKVKVAGIFDRIFYSSRQKSFLKKGMIK